ncbi:MAG: hypothetical protein IIB53_16285, partial [Planctomycetes bacterium]|nr:hypothetical protein [Planctomycetota bacterium]
MAVSIPGISMPKRPWPERFGTLQSTVFGNAPIRLVKGIFDIQSVWISPRRSRFSAEADGISRSYTATAASLIDEMMEGTGRVVGVGGSSFKEDADKACYFSWGRRRPMGVLNGRAGDILGPMHRATWHRRSDSGTLATAQCADFKFYRKAGSMQVASESTHYRVRFPNLSCRLLVIIALLFSPATRASDWDPPKPNPKNPVNYVEWVNETLGKGIKHNAFDDYMMAYGLIKPIDDKTAVFGRTGLTGGDGLSAWLRVSKKGLDVFRRASLANEYFYRSEPSEATGEPRVDQSTIVVMLPVLTQHRNIVKALLAEGNRASRYGNHPVLAANALTTLRSSHHLYRSPQIIGRMTGIASAALAYRGIANALASSTNPGSLDVQFVEALDAADPIIPPLSLQAQMARIMVWDFCQRAFEPAEKT